jgi:hypothetical protein
MDEQGWFPTNIKTYDETGGKYSHNVKDFIGKKDVIINYESKTGGEINPNKTKAYHVTPSNFLHKILKNGLTPRTESKLSDHPERIYLFLDNERSTFKSMSRALFNSLSDDKKKLINDYVVLEIDLTQLTNHKFYVDPQASATYKAIFTQQPIPKSAIKAIDKIPTSDLKPIISPEEEKQMDAERNKRLNDFSVDNTEYQNKLDNILNQLGDDETTISLDDLMNLQEQISRIKEMMKLNESNFFNRRIDLDRVKELIKRFAREVYYEAESYEQFRYELVLKAVEYIMWVDYEMGWDELPEQEEIEFNNRLANMYEPLINDLYKKIVEIDKEQ